MTYEATVVPNKGLLKNAIVCQFYIIIQITKIHKHSCSSDYYLPENCDFTSQQKTLFSKHQLKMNLQLFDKGYLYFFLNGYDNIFYFKHVN